MKIPRVIRLYFINSLIMQLSNLPGFLIFFFSKILRYSMFVVFLYFLTSSVSVVGNFGVYQMLTFYLIFNFIDTAGQMLFRETYRFRPLVVSGGFDLVLSKPFPPLLRVLIGGPDFIDVSILLVIIAALAYFSFRFIHPSLFNLIFFILLVINSLIIAGAFHILVLGVGILTLSVDHLIMIYRDLTALMRIPVDFLPLGLRYLFLFVLPVGIMFTIPAKMLLGLLSWQYVLLSFGIGLLALFLSLRFWSYSLRHYQSGGG